MALAVLGSAASLFNNMMLSGLLPQACLGLGLMPLTARMKGWRWEVGGGGGPASDGSTETEELLCNGHEAGGSARCGIYTSSSRWASELAGGPVKNKIVAGINCY